MGGGQPGHLMAGGAEPPAQVPQVDRGSCLDQVVVEATELEVTLDDVHRTVLPGSPRSTCLTSRPIRRSKSRTTYAESCARQRRVSVASTAIAGSVISRTEAAPSRVAAAASSPRNS